MTFYSYIIIAIFLLTNIQCKSNKPDEKKLESNGILGVDLSHHNGDINFRTLTSNNIYFAYLKSTEGKSLIDKKYAQNTLLAKENNIRTGAYHFFIFGTQGDEQANHFLNNTKFVSGDLIPVIDIEYSTINPYSTDSLYLKNLRFQINEFSTVVESSIGIRPIIYCNLELYNILIKDHFTKDKIWLANLKQEPESEINWILWQFEHDKRFNAELKVNLSKFRKELKNFHEIVIP